jgi:hypothetical protein
MSPQPLRASDAERVGTVERLSEAHSVGRISLEEFEERMASALAARTVAELTQLVEDLHVPADLPRLRSLVDDLLTVAGELGISRADLMAILIHAEDDDIARG